MKVEVVYCPAPGVADRSALELPEGSSVRRALHASGLLQRHPALEAEGQALAIGIWGKRCTPDTKLRERDRVEVYRPLQVDPKEARRLRYRAQGERGRRKPKA